MRSLFSLVRHPILLIWLSKQGNNYITKQLCLKQCHLFTVRTKVYRQLTITPLIIPFWISLFPLYFETCRWAFVLISAKMLICSAQSIQQSCRVENAPKQPQANAPKPVLECMKYTYIIRPCLCWSQDPASLFDLRSSLLCETICLPTRFFSVALVLFFKTRGWVKLGLDNILSAVYFHHFLYRGVLPQFNCIYLSPHVCLVLHWSQFHLPFSLLGFLTPSSSVVLRRKVVWMQFCSRRVWRTCHSWLALSLTYVCVL